MASLEGLKSDFVRDLPKLNVRQQRVFDYLQDFTVRHSYAPSIREISEALFFSGPSSVYKILTSLETKGYIKRASGISRSIEILEKALPPTQQPREIANPNLRPKIKPLVPSIPMAPRLPKVPLIGEIAAGAPILAEQNVIDYYDLPKEFRGLNETFMLRVKGDSMIGAGIFNHDFIIVNKQASAQNNEIVVAAIDNEVTVKRLKIKQGNIILMPENPAYRPIVPRDFQICGKVIGVYRQIR